VGGLIDSLRMFCQTDPFNKPTAAMIDLLFTLPVPRRISTDPFVHPPFAYLLLADGLR
jgi:hypothetical protein